MTTNVNTAQTKTAHGTDNKAEVSVAEGRVATGSATEGGVAEGGATEGGVAEGGAAEAAGRYCAKAPGKMILSGEHSVVYGADALAVAVNRHTTVRFTPVGQSRVINTLFSGISTGVSYPLAALSKLKHKLDARFESFSKGELPVQHILTHPNDLAMYALSVMMHQLPSRASLSAYLPKSGVLRTDSTIPEGAGMGSSASVIAATVTLFEHILERPLSVEQRFDMVRFCERLQHGRGSAIDAAAVTFGGINLLTCSGRESLSIQLDPNWYWLHTGTPRTSTGECVSFVRRYYGLDDNRWEQFNTVTRTLLQAIQDANACEIDVAVKENHRLLTSIGVVPAVCAELIETIESLGGSAKISGAGALAGDNAGLVLVHFDGDFKECVAQLQRRHRNYVQSYDRLCVATEGATIVSEPSCSSS